MHRNFLRLSTFVAVVLSLATAPASETIRSLVALSDVVLVGTITEAPEMMGGSAPLPSPVPKSFWLESMARIRVEAVLKGAHEDGPNQLISLRIPRVTQSFSPLDFRFSTPSLQTPFKNHSISIPFLRVSVVSDPPEMIESLAPFAKGKKIIFFLQDRRLREELGRAGKNDEPIFLVAFDPFLSALPYNEALELEIAKP